MSNDVLLELRKRINDIRKNFEKDDGAGIIEALIHRESIRIANMFFLIITSIRQFRNKFNITEDKSIDVDIFGPNMYIIGISDEINLPSLEIYIKNFKGCNVENINFVKDTYFYATMNDTQTYFIMNEEKDYHFPDFKYKSESLGNGVIIYFRIDNVIDLAKEKKDIEIEIERIENFILQINKKLNNEGFLKKAKKEVVELEQQKYKDFKEKLLQLNDYYWSSLWDIE